MTDLGFTLFPSIKCAKMINIYTTDNGPKLATGQPNGRLKIYITVLSCIWTTKVTESVF